jgi:ribosome silencing factor RsfS/YbeB/iojap
VPLEKKPSRTRPTKKVEDGAERGAAPKSKRSAGLKAPSKPGAAARQPHTAAKAAGQAGAAGKFGATPRVRGVQTPAAARAALKSVILGALDDMKALQVKVLDVRGLTDIADYMVIASGTSDRHVRSVAQRVVEKTKEAGYRPHGCEGLKDGDWVLIDLHEMIVHIMLPRVREFYGLEKLWDMSAKRIARA